MKVDIASDTGSKVVLVGLSRGTDEHRSRRRGNRSVRQGLASVDKATTSHAIGKTYETTVKVLARRDDARDDESSTTRQKAREGKAFSFGPAVSGAACATDAEWLLISERIAAKRREKKKRRGKFDDLF